MTLNPSGFGAAAGWSGGAFTSAAQAPADTALAPGYTWASGLSMGMYRVGVNILGFTTAGVVRAKISSAGLEVDTGNFSVPDGTAAAPAVTTLSDGNQGLWRPAAGVLGLAAAGADIARVTSSGLSLMAGSLSLSTSANDSGQTTGQLRVVFAASGISLVYSSGKSSYVLGQSSQSVAQA